MKLTAAAEERLEEAYREGISLDLLEERFGVRANAIIWIMKRRGVPLRSAAAVAERKERRKKS